MVVASAYQLIVRKVDVVASRATDETSGTKILEVSDETDLAVRGQRLKNESKTCLEYYHHMYTICFLNKWSQSKCKVPSLRYRFLCSFTW